jgi:O-antigen/teichoic acid export membrane protein
MSARPSPAYHPNYWLRSGLLTLLEKASGMVFALGTAMLLLRWLTKEDFAAWGLFLVITYFLEMGRSGLIQNGLVRFLNLHRDSPSDYAAISAASLTLNLGFSVVSNLLLWLATGWLIETWQVPQLAALLPVYFATNFVMAFLYHFNFVQQANFEFRGIFLSTFFARGVLFAWVFGSRVMGWGIELYPLPWATLAGAVLGAAGSWWFARPFLSPIQKIDFQWVLRLVAYGKFVLGTNLSAMFYKNADKLMLGSLLGPAAFSVYDAAGKVTQMVEAPSFSLAAVVFPQGADRMAREGAAGVKRLYERSVGATLAIILPFVVFVLVFADAVIHAFAGVQYAESAEVLRLTAFFGLFMPFAVQFGTVLDSTGRPATNFAYTAFTAVLNLGLSWVFIQQFGLLGAAFATLAGYSLSFVLMQIYLNKHFKINALNAFRHVPDFYKMGWSLLKNKMPALAWARAKKP